MALVALLLVPSLRVPEPGAAAHFLLRGEHLFASFHILNDAPHCLKHKVVIWVVQLKGSDFVRHHLAVQALVERS